MLGLLLLYIMLLVLVLVMLVLLLHIWHDILGSSGISGITSDKDATTFGRTDREATKTMLIVKLLELFLLLSPLLAALTFRTFVLLG